jgi:SAM-dependent methyltransferase
VKPDAEPVPFYDALAVDYDRFVNWNARLAHELPFLEDLFEVTDVGRVLDTACGTGQHSIALAQRGYEVVGTDLSQAMVRAARANARAAGVDVEFYVAGLGQQSSLAQDSSVAMTFDAALCLGNSLPHMLSPGAIEDALADFSSVLRPGGLLVIQNRNFDRVWAVRERFMGPQSYREPGREWLFVRFYDFHPETVTFNMIRLHRAGADWTQDIESTELRPIFQDELAASLSVTGFQRAEFYGGFDGSPFAPDESGDLLTVARRAAMG